jgi:hypothetical protein
MISAQSTTDYTASVVGSSTYLLSQSGNMGFRFDVNTGSNSASRWLSIGAQGTSAAGTAVNLTILFQGSEAYADVVTDSGSQLIDLGAILDNTNYVVEAQMTSTGTTLQLYQRRRRQ